ncbi:MAG: CRISPR-associated endonuclease Cas1 [Candidatus Dojkabacteria bacterium]|nr:MAG: CRISPR-associated endonuclease Cas1 [Candidatus Dojkabacteria bacterium]
MGFRNILISSNTKLSQKNSQIVIEKDGEKFEIPIEDIDTLVIDSQSLLTSNLIVSLTQNKVCAIVCNGKHLPEAIILPYQNHTRQSKRIMEQVSLTQPFKNQLWQQIVSQKIRNQAKVLKLLNFTLESNTLLTLSKQVKSSDKSNIEGRASGIYFTTIFGKNFTRDKDIFINSALNFTYALIRSNLARHCSAYGFIPSIGIKHCNEYNNFNLADDLIEPFRPIADYFLIRTLNLKQEDSNLTPQTKAHLMQIFEIEVIIKNQKTQLMTATEHVVKSLVSCIQNKNSKMLELPSFNRIKRICYE